jgi:CCR4-NOT transcription complex subunit 2
VNQEKSNGDGNGSSVDGKRTEEELTNMDRYGLNGLLPLIRMENNDQTTVAIGTDLNLLGLNMSEEYVDVKLSSFFASPWVETSRSEVEPMFEKKFDRVQVDDSVVAFQEKLPLFTDETLFFIFYTKTRDILQEFSSRELMSRNWRYHKELQVWLTKDSSVEPIQISNNSEKGLYIFFDPHSWEKIRKEFILNYQSIMS